MSDFKKAMEKRDCLIRELTDLMEVVAFDVQDLYGCDVLVPVFQENKFLDRRFAEMLFDRIVHGREIEIDWIGDETE